MTALLLALAYGAVRVYWAITGAPTFSPMPDDLVFFRGWGAAGLCGAAALAAAALLLTRRSRVAVAAAAAVTAGLFAAGAMFLLDIVGVLIGHLFAGENAVVSMSSRAACVALAIALGLATLRYLRRMRGACVRCGRVHDVRHTETPWWAVTGAWIAVLGCAVRIVAQLSVGFDDKGFFPTVSLFVFEGGFLLAGTLLPLALAYRFGRVWPRWVLGLAGRRVPRWLVLGPGAVFSAGLVVYFGIGLSQVIIAEFTGKGEGAFMWVAIPAYWFWGLGMGAAAFSYFRLTRPACRACGRGAASLA
ncbi:hypothetical protein Afil01_61330 [Actinorhabdospora filicis]|uniref:Uncharacterized protein n=1 Tax=Actinorhabdospora filicis TaxID=1785913 RepID=A0A9W6SV54_9ACTN|nr:hypothetical protein [Actinorhabdospora filicis]GLZ81326.1 hypothetical protein Afil01_61330 [Actinorhabdospora filicis]